MATKLPTKRHGALSIITKLPTTRGGASEIRAKEYLGELNAQDYPRGNVPSVSNYVKGADPRGTISNLVSKTPLTVRENSQAPSCRFRFVGVVTKPNGTKTFAWRCGCSGRDHITTIEILNPKAINPLQTPVRVHCTCEYFMFTLEVVLADAGLSDNRYALPQWPVIKNPGGSRHLCKHLIMVANDFVKRTRGGMLSQPVTNTKLLQTEDKAFTVSRQQAKERRR